MSVWRILKPRKAALSHGGGGLGLPPFWLSSNTPQTSHQVYDPHNFQSVSHPPHLAIYGNAATVFLAFTNLGISSADTADDMSI